MGTETLAGQCHMAWRAMCYMGNHGFGVQEDTGSNPKGDPHFEGVSIG